MVPRTVSGVSTGSMRSCTCNSAKQQTRHGRTTVEDLRVSTSGDRILTFVAAHLNSQAALASTLLFHAIALPLRGGDPAGQGNTRAARGTWHVNLCNAKLSSNYSLLGLQP